MSEEHRREPFKKASPDGAGAQEVVSLAEFRDKKIADDAHAARERANAPFQISEAERDALHTKSLEIRSRYAKRGSMVEDFMRRHVPEDESETADIVTAPEILTRNAFEIEREKASDMNIDDVRSIMSQYPENPNDIPAIRFVAVALRANELLGGSEL